MGQFHGATWNSESGSKKIHEGNGGKPVGAARASGAFTNSTRGLHRRHATDDLIDLESIKRTELDEFSFSFVLIFEKCRYRKATACDGDLHRRTREPFFLYGFE